MSTQEIAARPWQCPLCGTPLEPDLAQQGPGGWRCAQGHSFDRAKEGYCHLLPVQAMRTKAPGDSKEMVAARREFLGVGYYDIFGEALAQLCLEYGAPTQAAQNAPLHLLDAGCGEGWYDRRVAAAFAKAGRRLELAGFDIAKPAVRLAAKALPDAQYAVASSFHQPVRTGWADVVLNIFSPFAREEFLRVLRPGGRLLYAVPGAEHLYGMKAVLYDAPYKNPVQQVEYEGFAAIGEREVTGTITVPREHLGALFAMTPYYWKTPRGGAERLAALDSLTTAISFRFLVFEKK
jgi:23S rRNA (guanine745-N1)-methyltransferase